MADERIELLERVDPHAQVRNILRRIAADQEHWSGLPMPLEGQDLVIEKTHPHAEGLMKFKMARSRDNPTEPERAGDFDGYTLRNEFWSSHKRSRVVVVQSKDGKIDWGIVPGVHHLQQTLETLGCSDAWGVEQESKAVNLLGTLLRHHNFKQYLLCGAFLERSERSGVMYLFRRLKPTVAIVPHKVTQTRVLCALCMHAVGYYAGTWAGAMCPTDDVIAHLMLMRGDEPMFWRRCTQHPAWVPEAGL